MQHGRFIESGISRRLVGEDRDLERAMAALKPGDHLCCLYQTDEEHRALLTPYLRQGLERGEKVLCIVDAHTAETVFGYLSDDGLEVEPYLASGQLSILTANDAYARDGAFDPERMITLLRSETERALAEGYSALRATGEMTWALRGLAGSERLIEYESKLNELVPNIKFVALCQYDRRCFDPALLLDVLTTHPFAAVGTEIYENFYYIPTSEFLGPNRTESILRRWIDNLAERQRVEEQVRRLSRAVEQSPSTVVITDVNGNIEYVNPKFTRLTGYTFEEAIGQNPRILKSGEMAPEEYKRLWDTITAGEEWRGEFHNKKKNGELYWEFASISPIRNSQGVITQFLAVKEDITERKRAEEEIKKLNVDLERRAAELDSINKELEAFSYSVSHDLRAPLRSIDGFSQALLEDYEDRLDERGKDYLRRVRAASQRMAQLIDDLLSLSRVTRSEMRRETVNLSALAQEIAASLQKTQPGRQAEFVIEPVVIANGDARLLRIALENLLTNAWKFTGRHPSARIEFGVTRQEGRPVYFVRDDGAGFDMAYADKLFGAFRRLHTVDEFPGTGIGLATVQRIVHRHRGRIWAEGAVEQGATFYFTLS